MNAYKMNEIEEAARMYVSFAKDGIVNDRILDEVQVSGVRIQNKFWAIVDAELNNLNIELSTYPNKTYVKVGA